MLPIACVIVLLTLSSTVQGQNPEGRPNPCRNVQCLNGGTCDFPADLPICICQAGFFGDRCQFNRDPCFNFRCLNGGRCTAPADAPYCECPKGYTGNRCQFKDSGSCPPIHPGSAGICGGTFCSSDQDCVRRGGKCCPSACGGKLCTNVNASVDLFSLCEHFLCARTKVCRAVATTLEDPIPVARCVLFHQLKKELDQVCRQQNFLQAVLTPSKPTSNASVMNSLECSASGVSGKCPEGSVCVKGRDGPGSCCFQKSVPKPGTCPFVQLGGTGECSGKLCNVDEDCTSDDKCCESSCGDKLCTSPGPTYLGCLGGCDPGYTCEMLKYNCPVGWICPQIQVPKCVPLVDNCDKCSPGLVCIDKGVRCVTDPCPSFVCGPGDNPAQPVDECGGCPEGQTCQPNEIVCKKAPCPTHSCVPVDPAPVCTLLCRSGHRCVLKPMSCPAMNPNCESPPVAQCVPVELATCPKPDRELAAVCTAVVNECEADSDCDLGRFERCCFDACNSKHCTQVPLA